MQLQLVLLAILKDLALVISLRCQHFIKVKVLFQDFLNEEAACTDVSGIDKKRSDESFESIPNRLGGVIADERFDTIRLSSFIEMPS